MINYISMNNLMELEKKKVLYVVMALVTICVIYTLVDFIFHALAHMDELEISRSINVYDDGSYLSMDIKNVGYEHVIITNVYVIYDDVNSSPLSLVNDDLELGEYAYVDGRILSPEGIPVILDKGTEYQVRIQHIVGKYNLSQWEIITAR